MQLPVWATPAFDRLYHTDKECKNREAGTVLMLPEFAEAIWGHQPCPECRK